MAIYTNRSKVSRAVKSTLAAMICGALLSLPFAKPVLATDAKTVVSEILNQAIPEFQRQMASMGLGCSGGSNGTAPFHWDTRQEPGNKAVKSLSDARVSLAENKTDAAKSQIATGLGQWDQLIASLHESCSGGSNGEDPVAYPGYVRYRDLVKERLNTALQFL